MTNLTKSLRSRSHKLADTTYQVEVLNIHGTKCKTPTFQERLNEIGIDSLKSSKVEILQVNLGKMCNQTCKHCHVDAGPDRKEIMNKETMQSCLEAVKKSEIQTVDLTGGAPEMNPHFRWFVEELKNLNVSVLVRCNLTIIVSNHKYLDLPEFYKANNVTIISSLPHFSARRTDAQRGEGVFEKSIKALKMLNGVGYGISGSGLELHLVYNPSGAFLPPSQSSLKKDFKRKLWEDHSVEFNDLYAITNMPISRFLDYLIQSGNYESYMEKLVEAFNPSALMGVMCLDTLSVGWDGNIYDCDFNQMLDLPVSKDSPRHISNFDAEKLADRPIVLNQHCFGCTAGAGSSCGGEII